MQHTVCSWAIVRRMRLTKPGADYRPARHTTGRGHGQHDRASARRSWTSGRARFGSRGRILGTASHSGDLLARTDSARGSPGGSQGAGVEHHPVHRPGSATRRRRLRVALLAETNIPGGLCFWNALERDPEPIFRALDRIAVATRTTSSIAHNVALTWEGDIPGDVTLQPGVPTRTGWDRADRGRADVVPDGVSSHRNLQKRLPLASEGDVQGDTRRASSFSRSTILWPTNAYSGTHRRSRPARGDEG